ncbi:folylpolyglutamate synthase/dihydrofolate synthase family protein [Croceicoccus sp. F390]|uniref:Dihydrofolate synthase/folylpolyglutamate synthase n=1 Tax=Croceicoccus esteveae TaxID=3075597 RepID=A0ABU2ZJ92_9SPHN|nr:folylpolyglutamate synthase/dihydrofolate synthase family protein [Croceicoccus sp. F390]MDT0576671.1 folylpolyglutamate synthase/dihydrofolate synthase family protein [Croceicoccus sp. F390]
MRDLARSDDARVQAQLDRLAGLSVPQGRLSLAPIRALLDRLGNPQRDLPPVFHVAGTNGKGSTCAFLRAIIEADDKTVHQFTSPHLVRYNERIRLAGCLIEDDLLAALLEEVLDRCGDIPASFFEVTTATAFLAFARSPADATIVEVGLGGRFDATNVLEHPACCGIAALGLDHEAFLLVPEPGTPQLPIARIAFEKAGIIKPGVPIVTVAHDRAEAVRQIEHASALAGAPLHVQGADWTIAGATPVEYADRHGQLTLPPPALPGSHQLANAGLAIAMLRHQDFLTVSPSAFAQGLRNVSWPARLQWLAQGPLTQRAGPLQILLDGGHNPAAAAALANYLATIKVPVHAIIGMLSSKDAVGFITTIASHLSSLTAVPISGHDHHVPQDLCTIAAELACEVQDDIHSAIDSIAARAAANDVILVCGSLYLAGEVLHANRQLPS